MLPPKNSRGGRPKDPGAGRKQKKQAPGVRKQRADPTAQAKLKLHQELVELSQQPGLSKYKASQIIGSKYGLSMTADRYNGSDQRVCGPETSMQARFEKKRQPLKHGEGDQQGPRQSRATERQPARSQRQMPSGLDGHSLVGSARREPAT